MEILRLRMVIGCLTDLCHALYDPLSLSWLDAQLVNYKGSIWSESELIDSLRIDALRSLSCCGRDDRDSLTLLCTDQQGINYYHFLIDILPKLISLERYAKDIDFKYNKIVLSDFPLFARQLLELGDFRRCQVSVVRSQGSGFLYHFRHSNALLHASHRPDIPLEKRISLIKEYLSDSCSSLFSASGSGVGLKIFIERRESDNRCFHRHVLPLDKFHEFLKNHGFTIVFLEDLSVLDQISLFRVPMSW